MSKTKKASPIYVVAGKDKYLVASECDKIVDSLLSPDEKGMGLLVCDPDKTEISELFDELRTLPFLSSRRVVLVKDAESFITNNRNALEKYFESPSPSGSLILTVPTWRGTTKLAKKLKKCGTLLNVAELKRGSLAKYALDYAKTNTGKKIDLATANMIVELVGDEPGKICSEIDKLCVYADDSPTITIKHVQELTQNNREFDLFAVIDSMTDGDTEKAITKLRNMFTSDKNAAYRAVGGFAFHFRKMFEAKVMQSKRTPDMHIAQALRIFGNRNSYFSQLRKWRLTDISRVIQALARIDYQSKTGQTSVPTAIEMLVLKISLKHRQRR